MSRLFELDLEPLVRFVFSRMGMNQNQITRVDSFKKAIHDLKEKYADGKTKMAEVLDRCHRAIQVITSMLDAEFGISTTQYIPSQNVLIPLFDAAYEIGYESADRSTGPAELRESRSICSRPATRTCSDGSRCADLPTHWRVICSSATLPNCVSRPRGPARAP